MVDQYCYEKQGRRDDSHQCIFISLVSLDNIDGHNTHESPKVTRVVNVLIPLCAGLWAALTDARLA